MKDFFSGEEVMLRATSVISGSRRKKPKSVSEAFAAPVIKVEDSALHFIRPYPGTPEARQERLHELRESLLSRFMGIDSIIDSILSRICSWYVSPEKSDRPLIVNLWGTTGVGKTCLVRAIRDYLGFSSSYLEIVLSNKENGYDVSDEIDTGSTIGTGAPGIILFDEFQRLRSKDSHGEPLRGLGYQDIWQILSDGMVSTKLPLSSVYSLMGRLNWSPFSGFGEASKPDASDSDSIGLADANAWRTMESALGYSLGASPEKVAKSLPKDLSILQGSKKNLNALSRLLKASGIETGGTLEGILHGAHALMVSCGHQGDLSSSADYTKCLIFVAGNLDQLYSHHLGDVPVTAPADYVRQLSSGISVPDVKESLGSLFFPEQVARLGNIHITYSTLDSSGYHGIIKAHMADYVKSLAEKGLSIDGSVYELIYRNGVYPLQGVRPVLSTISEVVSEINSMLSLFQVKHGSLASEASVISYSVPDVSLLIRSAAGATLYSYRYIGGKDSVLVPLSKDCDYVRFASIHEAGHAVTYYVRTGGVVPSMMFIDNTRAATEMGLGKGSTADTLCATMEATMAGVVATRKTGLSDEDLGHIGDYSAATHMATGMIRNKALGPYLGRRYGLTVPAFINSAHRSYTIPPDPDISGTSLIGPNDGSEGEFVSAVLSSAAKVAEDVVSEHWGAVVKVAGKLADRLFLSQEDIRDVLESSIRRTDLRQPTPSIKPPDPLR